MAIQVQILDDAGLPLEVGFTVELVKEGVVLSTAKLGSDGKVTFDVEAQGPLAVRFAKSDELVRRK